MPVTNKTANLKNFRNFEKFCECPCRQTVNGQCDVRDVGGQLSILSSLCRFNVEVEGMLGMVQVRDAQVSVFPPDFYLLLRCPKSLRPALAADGGVEP